MADILHLIPPLYDVGSHEEFEKSGQTLSLAVSPANSSALSIFATPAALKQESRSADPEQPIYVVSLDKPPSSERRTFITDTFVIFAAFRKLLEGADNTVEQPLFEQEYRDAATKLGLDFVFHTKEAWVHASQPIDRPPLQYTPDHYRTLYTCFSLFVLLYLPDLRLERAPVGDELLEWLNTHFIDPPTEEGDHLTHLSKPWEDDNFWPYLTRATMRGLTKASVFFFEKLSQHPSHYVQSLSAKLVPLVSSLPRLQDYAAERDFTHASKGWKKKVEELRIELDRLRDSEKGREWYTWLDDIVALLEGRGDVVKRICYDLGCEWKEVCAIWGVFVDPRLRRADIPDLVATIIEDLPPDPTDVEDMVHMHLLSGDAVEALKEAAKLDIWLAAHMADMMEPLDLLVGSLDDPADLTLRQHYLLSYGEYLHSDPALWRIAVEYMFPCGEIGAAHADEVLLHTPLRLTKADTQQQDDVTDEQDVVPGDVVGEVTALNICCRNHNREAVRRKICSNAARALVDLQLYGLAVAWYGSAEDWPGLGRTVERILGEYITKGPVVFSRLVEDVASSLAELQDRSGANAIFVHRLRFAVAYAEFHKRKLEQDLQDAAFILVAMFQEEIAPKSWWGVLLCDAVDLLQFGGTMLFTSAGACELLHRLEEINIRATQGSGDDYLSTLKRTAKVDSDREALLQLQPVRLALARYMARCAVIGVGGKDGAILARQAPPLGSQAVF